MDFLFKFNSIGRLFYIPGCLCLIFNKFSVFPLLIFLFFHCYTLQYEIDSLSQTCDLK